jgi:protoheme IX farnesyltransferase
VNREPEDLSAELQLSLFWTVRYRLQAAKVPLCLLVAFSSLLGFVLFASRLGWLGCGVFISVLLLACGGATLNSYQEHRCDRLMERTRRRPVASGVLFPESARRQGQLLSGAGLLLLYLTTWSAPAVVAGAAALVLYNAVYTPLKQRTIWAIVPGALCGAMPPYIGWLAAGGTVLSPAILAVTASMVLWQVPHFWLVLLSYRSQYRCSTQPNLARMMAEPVLKYLSVVWVAALLVVLQTMVAMMTAMPVGLRIMISATGFGLLLVFSILMVVRREPNYRFLFMLLNMFMLYIMAMFTVGSLVV